MVADIVIGVLLIAAFSVCMFIIWRPGLYNVKHVDTYGDTAYFIKPIYAFGKSGELPELVTTSFSRAKWAYREADGDKYLVVYEAGEKSHRCLICGKEK